MSFRMLTNRLFKQSRYALQWYYKRDIFTNILEHGRNRGIPTTHLHKAGGQQQQQQYKSQVALRASSGLFRFGQHARKLFIDNILNRVTSSYSTDLRTRATKKLFYGDSAPFFALVGVSLASGAGVLTKEDELEGVCWEIREAASRIQHSWSREEVPATTIDDDFTLDSLDIGPPIAKGCAAVVYAASFKNPQTHDDTNAADVSPPAPLSVPIDLQSPQNNVDIPISSPRRNSILFSYQNSTNTLSPIANLSRFVHNFGGSVDNLFSYGNSHMGSGRNPSQISLLPNKDGAEYAAGLVDGNRSRNKSGTSEYDFLEDNLSMTAMDVSTSTVNICRYPLALKMMFNYDIQSNAMSILRAMYKETIPARYRPNDATSDGWEKLLRDQTLTLPPHPNIVLMLGYFCAEVRNLMGGCTLYPMAQPPRINPQGYGRNMSLYLLMKRYDCNLHSYLESENITMRTRILLFAQLLEAIAHLARHGIAHRDLKSDNILIELNDDSSPPVLVLSDFGCCLADKVHGLSIPYTSYDMDKGGNTALMAPEIINKTPGTFSFLNYTKSDLWACGAIAYEIFGHRNPFYATNLPESSTEENSLRNVNYREEDLPDLGIDCPHIIRELIANILNPNPNRRLSPDIAANVMQLYLWAPSSWLKSAGMPSSPEILQWLLSLTTKVMCEGRKTTISSNTISYKMGRRTYTEYLLICSFLARAKLRRLRGALTWIQSIV